MTKSEFHKLMEPLAFQKEIPNQTPPATHRAMGYTNYAIDLNDVDMRNLFCESLGKSSFWQAAIGTSTQNPSNRYPNGSVDKLAHLMEVTPKRNSRFFADIDSLQSRNDDNSYLPLETVIERAWDWTCKIFNMDLCPHKPNMYVFHCEKIDKHTKEMEHKLHIYWPELVVNSANNQAKYAKDLENALGIKKIDTSVYKSGLRLPGFLKRNEIIFYKWYPINNTQTPPTPEHIILLPHPDQNDFPQRNLYVAENILSLPDRFAFDKKRKRTEVADDDADDFYDPTPYSNMNDEIVKHEISIHYPKIKNEPVSWNVKLPGNVLMYVANHSTFKPEFKVKGKGRTKYTWFVDYNREETKECCYGQHHTSWKFLLNWNPKTQAIRVACLKPECLQKGWVTIKNAEKNEAETPLPDPKSLCDTWEKIVYQPSDEQTIFSPHIIKQLKRKPFEALEYLNEFVACIGKPTGFVHRLTDNDWSMCKKEDLINFLAPFTVENVNFDFVDSDDEEEHPDTQKSGRPKKTYIPIFELWTKWRERRTFQKFIFDPRFPPSGGTSKNPSQFINLYKGFAVQPTKYPQEVLMKKIDAVMTLLNEGWCNGNADKFDWILNLFAHIIQKPHEPTRVAVVLQSEQGCGKNIIFDLFKKIWPDHIVFPGSMESVLNGFNDHIAPALMLVFDEIIYNNSSKEAQHLKKLITSQIMEINQKYHKTIYVDNLVNCFILSNHYKVVHLEAGDRRYVIFVLSDKFKKRLAGYRKGDKKQRTIFDDILDTEPGAWLQFLLERDITGFDPTHLIDSEERVRQIVEHLEPDASFVYNLIRDESDFWGQTIPTNDVWTYINTSLFPKKPHLTRDAFFYQLYHKFGIKTSKVRSDTGRKWLTSFPTMEEAKQKLKHLLNTNLLDSLFD